MIYKIQLEISDIDYSRSEFPNLRFNFIKSEFPCPSDLYSVESNSLSDLMKFISDYSTGSDDEFLYDRIV